RSRRSPSVTRSGGRGSDRTRTAGPGRDRRHVSGGDPTGLDGPDLVVAGAGGGLVAALRAAQLGLDVLVLERQEQFAVGNNTAMSTAMIPGAGSRWQREQGVDDSPERFLDDIRAKTGGDFEERIARGTGEVSAPLGEGV